MIADYLLWPYLIAALVCILSPGTDSLGTLTIGLARGQRPAMAFAAGVGAGCLTHTLWATIGIATIVATSDTLFNSIKYAGAVYLLWIGVKALRAPAIAINYSTQSPTGSDITTAAGEAIAKTFLHGLFSNAMNPKVMLFFIAFLPQFVVNNSAANNPVWLQMMILGIIFAAITGTLYVLLGYASGGVGQFLKRRPIFLKWINRLSGMVFIGLALKLALTDRKV
jgi:threonine/homoserine/homoserine lactone efflux protein